MPALVQLKDVVALVAVSTMGTFAAHNVYPTDGEVPGVNDQPDGAEPNKPVAHVYVADPTGPDGIVAAH